MWKLSVLCSFMAIITGIILNVISNSIQNKQAHLVKLEKQINEKKEKLRILETEWEYHTHPKKLIELAETELGMSSREVDQIGQIKMVKIRGSAWTMGELSTESLLKTHFQKTNGKIN